MKYLSIILLFAFMAISWKLVHNPKGVSEEVHMSIQDELKRIIAEQIANAYPNSDQIFVEKLWTEPAKNNRVKAVFKYSYNDSNSPQDTARIDVEGYTYLKKAADSNSEKEVWTFDEVHFMNNHIQFEEGVLIEADYGSSSEQ